MLIVYNIYVAISPEDLLSTTTAPISEGVEAMRFCCASAGLVFCSESFILRAECSVRPLSIFLLFWHTSHSLRAFSISVLEQTAPS